MEIYSGKYLTDVTAETFETHGNPCLSLAENVESRQAARRLKQRIQNVYYFLYSH